MYIHSCENLIKVSNYFCVNRIAMLIILPIIVLQFILATFCNVKLVNCKLRNARQYMFWNVIIILIFFIGPIIFLIKYPSFEKLNIKNKDDNNDLKKEILEVEKEKNKNDDLEKK